MKNNKDAIVFGFALFAMFFGAGNLIFPPYLGMMSGPDWAIGFAGFIIADVGLALLAIAAASKCSGDINQMLSKVGKKLSLVLGCLIMVCLGPLLAIPRTAATTFEMGVAPITDSISPVLFSVVFFGITLALTIKPSKIVDIIGQVLTPVLFIALLVLIIKGISSPIGEISQASQISGVFSEGIAQGYQTMDALGATALSAVIMVSIAAKGYKSDKDKMQVIMKASVVAAIGLVIVYGGLTYLGATVSQMYTKEINQTTLILDITSLILGNGGKIVLAVIVSLACLTTAVGLTSATAQYFTTITNGKVKYTTVVIVVSVFSAVVSNFGVNTIIQFSAPILGIIYPAMITVVMITLVDNKIKNKNVYKGAVYGALTISILELVSSMIVEIPLLSSLPLASLGFAWVVPAIVGGVIANFIKSDKNIAKKDIVA